MIVIMKHHTIVLFASLLFAFGLHAELVLPPQITSAEVIFNGHAYVGVQSSIGQSGDSKEDRVSALYIDEDFFWPVDLEAAQGDISSLMQGEVSLNRAADGSVLEYVLAGSFSPDNSVVIEPDWIHESTSVASAGLDVELSLSTPAAVTLELFLVGDNHEGDVALSIYDLTTAEGLQFNAIDGSLYRRINFASGPGTTNINLDIATESEANASSWNGHFAYHESGGDLEYLVRITVDPDEEFQPPAPTLRISGPIQLMSGLNLGNLVPGLTYRLEQAPNLSPDAWEERYSFMAHQEKYTFFEPVPSGWDRVFYRLVLVGDE